MCHCLKAWRKASTAEIVRGIKWFALVSCVLALVTACGTSARAPITEKKVSVSSARISKPSAITKKRQPRPKTYTVVRGDTLQAIAWRFGLDHQQIARWNNIRNANLIFVGQKLRLTPAKSQKRSGATSSATTGKSSSKSQSQRSVAQKPVGWRWPAQGKVQKATSALGTKGIEIRGTRGSPIVAAANGKVVYSGNGLRGYGNLIIVQHNETYLSAYAHNEKLLISEGARVNAGQKIATMGNSGTKQVMLHFEIRRNGKAVEPTNYLPRH